LQKAAVKFLTDNINAAIIGEPTSEVIDSEKGIPKSIKFSVMSGTATGEYHSNLYMLSGLIKKQLLYISVK
jgi:hypothetical protein